MSAKMKKIVSTVVIIALLVILGVNYLKNRDVQQEAESTSTEFSVETLASDSTEGSDTEKSTKSDTESESESITETTEESASKSASETVTEKETTEATTVEETTTKETTATETTTESALSVKKNGEYSDKESVALYIHTYGCLPKNYITKDEAEDLGWSSSKGNLWKVAYGKSIGGDYFGNYEGKLPKKSGRKYYECDIDFDGGYRNEKRIIYSNDGLIYYTDDHYNTFEQLY